MKTNAPRIILASIALISFAGLASPADAAPTQPTTLRNVWCC